MTAPDRSEASVPSPSALPERPAGPARLLRVSRGFAGVFWAMPLLALAHAAGLGGGLSVRWTIGLGLAGFLPLLWGLWRLRWSGELTSRWGGRIARTLWLAMGTIYLSPFLAWWSAVPEQTYFAVNVGVHYLLWIGLLAALNAVAGEAGRWMGDGGLRREAKAGLGMVVWLSGCTVAALAWLYHRAGILDAGWPTVSAHLAQLPREARMLFLLPYAMTAYVMWRAKETVLRRMVGDDS